jgi:multidrug efflux pump subunit AcrB
MLREVPGARDVLALTSSPFDRPRGRPCLLISLPGGKEKRDQAARDIRARIAEQVPDAALRLRDLSGRLPRCGYPINLAVRGPETGRVREWAEKLAGRLRGYDKVTDVWADRASTPRPRATVEVDRARAIALRVSLDELFSTLQVNLGSAHVGDFNRFGRSWPINLQLASPRGRGDGALKLSVRNAEGQLIPLSALAATRAVSAPEVVDRLDFQPMVGIGASPVAGKSPRQVRSRCEALAEEVRKELGLSGEYRLSWLQESPAR